MSAVQLNNADEFDCIHFVLNFCDFISDEKFCMPCKIYKEKLVVYSCPCELPRETTLSLQIPVERSEIHSTPPSGAGVLSDISDGSEFIQNHAVFESECAAMASYPKTPRQAKGFKMYCRFGSSVKPWSRRSKRTRLSQFRFQQANGPKILPHHKSPFAKTKLVLQNGHLKDASKSKRNIASDALTSKCEKSVMQKQLNCNDAALPLQISCKLNDAFKAQLGESEKSRSDLVSKLFSLNSMDKTNLSVKDNSCEEKFVRPEYINQMNVTVSALPVESLKGEDSFSGKINKHSRKREMPETDVKSVSKKLCMMKNSINSGKSYPAPLTERKNSETPKENGFEVEFVQRGNVIKDHVISTVSSRLMKILENTEVEPEGIKCDEDNLDKCPKDKVVIQQNCSSEKIFIDDANRKELIAENKINTRDQENHAAIGNVINAKLSADSTNPQRSRRLTTKKNLGILTAVSQNPAIFNSLKGSSDLSVGATSNATKCSVFNNDESQESATDSKMEETNEFARDPMSQDVVASVFKSCDEKAAFGSSSVLGNHALHKQVGIELSTSTKSLVHVNSKAALATSSLCLRDPCESSINFCSSTFKNVQQSTLNLPSNAASHCISPVIVVSDDDGDNVDAEIKALRYHNHHSWSNLLINHFLNVFLAILIFSKSDR